MFPPADGRAPWRLVAYPASAARGGSRDHGDQPRCRPGVASVAGDARRLDRLQPDLFSLALGRPVGGLLEGDWLDQLLGREQPLAARQARDQHLEQLPVEVAAVDASRLDAVLAEGREPVVVVTA